MVRLAGLEPATLGLEGRCSIQMSYKRVVVGVEGFEPPTSCSQSRRATKLRYTPIDLLIDSFVNCLKETRIIRIMKLSVKWFLQNLRANLTINTPVNNNLGYSMLINQ
jgi:hypothetical protein